jgi:hypothetical protein
MELVRSKLAVAGSPKEMVEKIFTLGKKELLTEIMLL